MARQRVSSTLGVAEYGHLVDQLPHVIMLVADRNMRFALAGGQGLPGRAGVPMSCWAGAPAR